jgi:hypothetical protein
MRLKTVLQCGIALGLACLTAGCQSLFPPHQYSGPGCLIYIYGMPGMQGYALPIRTDTVQLADPWEKMAASAKVVYGMWRLYSEPNFEGFMGDYKAPAEIVQLNPEHQLGSLQCLEPAPEPAPTY